jgi:hypothetical protein
MNEGIGLRFFVLRNPMPIFKSDIRISKSETGFDFDQALAFRISCFEFRVFF